MVNQYRETLSEIENCYKAGSLYTKHFDQGKITNKSLGGLLWSVAQHAFYVVTCQTKKIECIEKEQLNLLFAQSISYLDANKSSKNLSSTKNSASGNRLSSSMLLKEFPFIQELIKESPNQSAPDTFELKKTKAQPVSPKKISFTASVDISSSRSGLLGKSSQRQLMPDYLKKFYKENERFSQDENDLLIECNLSDCSSDTFPSGKVWLPAQLFGDKDYKNSVYFQYNGKQVQLNIEKHYTWDSFQETINTFRSAPPSHPIFGIDNPNAWYSLGENGSIYKWNKSGDPQTPPGIQEADAQCFRQKKSPTHVDADILRVENNNILLLVNFPGFELSDLDLIINEKYLIIYGISTPKGYPEGFTKEKIFKFDWKNSSQFSAFTLDEMKKKIGESHAAIHNGQLEILISW
jgi:HSP20 family molecular chaperone IbpA